MPARSLPEMSFQFLSGDPQRASECTGQAFRLPLLKPMSAKSLPELLGERPIHPGCGTTDQTGCLASSLQFRKPRVYLPGHGAAFAGLGSSRFIAPGPSALLP
jgi:hypothetical protein